MEIGKKIIQTLLAAIMPVKLGGTPRKYIFESTKPTRERLQGVANLMKDEKIKAVIDSVFSFEDVINAYERQMSHKAIGKVVIEVSALD